MDVEDLIRVARAYASRHGLLLAERLGSGRQGIVYAAQSKVFPGARAIKILGEADAYQCEKRAYLRLREREVGMIEGFNIPQLIGYDDQALVIDMTIVSTPFLLDFASAALDKPPEFSDVIWEQWELEKIEQFGERWDTVQTALFKLRGLGIYMLDASPANIRFE